ncbi:MAG: sulfotransferase domain-containing protein [Geminicoccaceae bacterium]
MRVLHPGFPRTATTTLQQAVFPHHPQLAFLGVPAAEPALDQLLRGIAETDSTRFDATETAAGLAPHLALPPGRSTLLLSFENLTLYEARDKGVVAARLRTLFGPARIMFTLRRQDELAASWYLQKIRKYIDDHHYVSPQRYFRMKLREPGRSILGDLDFEATVACYERLFGAGNVRLFAYEQLRADPAAFAADVAGFLAVDPGPLQELLHAARLNRGETRRRLAKARLVDRYLPRAVLDRGRRLLPRGLRAGVERWLDGGERASVALPAAVRDWIDGQCRRGNRALDARYGGLLGRWGYPL